MHFFRKRALSPPSIIPPVSDHEDWLERAAFGASFLCLFHCLALPLLIAALPALARIVAIPESVHIWLLLFAAPASGAALISGRARHGAPWPLVIGAFGLLFLALGALMFGGSAAETPSTIVGSLALATAHIANWRLRHARHAHG